MPMQVSMEYTQARYHITPSIKYEATHADLESFAERGPTLTCFFFSDNKAEWIYMKIPFKAGHHRPASETPFTWP